MKNKMKKESKIFRLVGEINIASGAVRKVDRRFNGLGALENAVISELQKRRDSGSPWYGDAINVIKPNGEIVSVNVPWPGESS